jgi:hypothetical protein
METVCYSACDSPDEISDAKELENRIHREFWTAFAAWEDGPDYQKAKAASRLDQSVRQLYDFVVRGRIPQRMADFRSVSGGR